MTTPNGSDNAPGRESGESVGQNGPVLTAPSSRTASLALARAGNVIGPGSPADERDRLDTANASLLDALRITFRLLVGGMVVLAVLYVLSGFQTVREGERAVRTVFGAVQASDLGPGFRFSFPYPVGDLIRVETSQPPLTEDTRFWPTTDGARTRGADEIPARFSLEPGRDGSLITADGNIVHARFSIVYRRNDLGRYVRNVYPGHERAMVLSAVRRGVVTAVAEVTIDDLLKQSSSEPGSVAFRAREIAQRTLDDAETGLFIEQLRMVDRVPPGALRQAFNSVQDAEANAARVVSESEQVARELLNATGGQVVGVLVDLIEQYGRALELGETEQAGSLLARIEGVLEGQATEVPELGDVPAVVSGRVTEILNDARRGATRAVSEARSSRERFLAVEAQYRENPQLTVQLLWQGALTSLMARPFVQSMLLPISDTDTLRVRLNQDPALARELDRERKRQEAEEALQERNRARDLERFRTQTGQTVTSGG